MTPIREDSEIPKGETVEVPLPNDATAAGVARQSVRDILTRWRLPSLVDACVLAVSELVTNALRHGRPPIGMHLTRRGGDVRVDVHDSDPEPIPPICSDEVRGLTESGRGLEIVRKISDHTGSAHIPGDGKTMYASWHSDQEPRERPAP